MKPILKWAGGKRWLAPLIKEAFEPYQQTKLVEPFAGGMAVACQLNPARAQLNDTNPHLINFYQQIKKGLKISASFKNESLFYYRMREEFNTLIRHKRIRNKRAAEIFYFLIKTGFNGLCRFNQKGEFNVPFGQHPIITYQTDFSPYQSFLARWEFTHQDFESLALEGEEFLYADPPYDVEFTRYHAKGFYWADQIRLAHWLAKHPGPTITSNQATPRILALYTACHFDILTLSAPRRIACNGNRTPAIEMLALRNFTPNQIKALQKCARKLG